MISIPKGTKDMLPSQAYKWHFVENCARSAAALFNIREIRTPIFEHTELFLRGVGGTTDIVNKEMYTFNDKGGRSITLKPEGTAGVVRAFIENGLASSPMPLKMYYLTPVFRYERPQAGRLRQHHQFGIEYFGAQSAAADCEVILVARTFFDMLKIDGLKLNINSIGCPKCRPSFNARMIEFLREKTGELCPLCRERIQNNPLRALDCKEESCRKILKYAPDTIDYICGECKEHFENLQKYLTECGIEYSINTKIVRGLDYYTKTVFEFVTDKIGAQGTVCGGGRYDNLMEQLGGNSLPGLGFGIGLERLLMLLDEENIPVPKPLNVYIAPAQSQNGIFCAALAQKLRDSGISAETDLCGRSLKAQLKYADKIGVRFVIVIGDSEMQNGGAPLKNMESGEERFIGFDDIAEHIKQL